MQHLSKQELTRRALRSAVCPECPMRPPGSEALGPSVARNCEPQCAVLQNAEALLRIAKQTEGSVCAPFERAIQDQICSRCTLSESAGDYCADALARTCVLSRQARDALYVLERWMERDQQMRRRAARLKMRSPQRAENKRVMHP